MCDNIDLPSNFDNAKGLCEEQCSVDCPSVWRGDGECDDNDYVCLYVKSFRIALDVINQNRILGVIQNHVIMTMEIVHVK